jgi:hypothetical protein
MSEDQNRRKGGLSESEGKVGEEIRVPEMPEKGLEHPWHE